MEGALVKASLEVKEEVANEGNLPEPEETKTKAVFISDGKHGHHHHLELSLRISSNGYDATELHTTQATTSITSQEKLLVHQRNDGGGERLAKFSSAATMCGGFVHPWSLAARQEKAALEQTLQRQRSITTRRRSPTSSPVVGWPPLRAFRRSLAGASKPGNTSIEKEWNKSPETPYPANGEVNAATASDDRKLEKTTMFVKVNMEGYLVGRKIDLKAHDGYDSLSLSIKNMFSNFFSEVEEASFFNSSMKKQEKDEDAKEKRSFVLLYEDHEGDRMLVGDVPWAIFVASVKRLYIAHDRTSKEGREIGDDQAMEVEENK